jgi:catalase
VLHAPGNAAHRSQDGERVIMDTSGPRESAIDEDLGERYYKGDETLEQKLTQEIIAVIGEFIDRRFREGRQPALRDAHAKDTGCVKAIFRVNKDLPRELRRGVFGTEQDYDAWIRFSDGNSEVRSSRWPDARGMAIKLMGVKGDKLLDETDTQDFIMANHPAFFIDDLQEYLDTLKVFHSGRTLQQLLSVFKLKPHEIPLAIRVNFTLITNPLFSQYWSMTPYRLGAAPGERTAIKFTAKPRLANTGNFLWKAATYLAPGFSLKKEMAKVLAAREMWFDFYIQRFRSHDRTPIEDSRKIWTEEVSPPEPVAKIIIPCQDVISDERDRFCENLSFNPWHCLADHKPLGAVNRVRRPIYFEISSQRHRLNAQPHRQPTGLETV